MADVQVTHGKSPSATYVKVGGIQVLFSYDTPVAFRVGYGDWVASENVWSQTTGKHLSETGVAKKDRLPHGEFRQRLDALLARVEVLTL